jgi:hypothetical protein
MSLVMLAIQQARASGAQLAPRQRLFTGFVCGLVLAAIAAPVQAQNPLRGYSPLYVTAGAGYARSDISPAAMDRRFAEAGLSVNTQSTEGSRASWNLGIGYRATDRVALEVDYLNLGDVDVHFESQATGSELAAVYPESGHGAAIAALYRYPLSPRWGASAKAGVFLWQGEFETYQGSVRVGDKEGRNETLFYGLEVDYLLSPAWSVGGEIQRFAFANDPTLAVSLELKFRFLEWLDAH